MSFLPVSSNHHTKLHQSEEDADDADSDDFSTSDSDSLTITTTKHGYFETTSQSAKDASPSKSPSNELPLVTYCKRWKCCFFCRGKKVYDSLLEENDSSSVSALDDDTKSAPQTTTEKAQEALIYEECLDVATDLMIWNSSWVNASILGLALESTIWIEFKNVSDTKAECQNHWIYFTVILIVCVISLFLPKCWENTDSLQRDLEVKIERKENKLRRQNGRRKMMMLTLCNYDSKSNLSETASVSVANSRKESSAKKQAAWILGLAEQEVNELLSKFNILIIASLSCAFAFGLRDAARSTLSVIVDDTDGISSTAAFFYALVMTVFGIYIVVRLGKYRQLKEGETIECIQDPHANEKEKRKKLLSYSLLKRTETLIVSAIKFSMAWAWRECINELIDAVYGDDDGTNNLVHQWGYTVAISLFVATLFAVNNDYFIIYPRNIEAQQQFLENEWRSTTNVLLADNMKYVVGMSWFDSVVASVMKGDLSNQKSAGIYWGLAILGISLSVVGTHFVTKLELRQKIASQGLMQAVFDTMERFYDPRCVMHSEGDVDLVPSLCDGTMFEILSVTIFGWGVAGSLLCNKAITYTLYSAVPGWDDVEQDDGIVKNREQIYILWIAFFICVGITLAMTVYVGKLINGMKSARRMFFRKLKRKQSMMQKEELEKELDLEMKH